ELAPPAHPLHPAHRGRGDRRHRARGAPADPGRARRVDDHGVHRHDRAADGHPAAAVLRHAARRERHRGGVPRLVVLDRAAALGADVGAVLRPVRPAAGAARRARGERGGVRDLRLRHLAHRALPLAHRAGRGRGHHRRRAGVRRRLHAAQRAHQGARLAVGGHQPRRRARPGARRLRARDERPLRGARAHLAICVARLAGAARRGALPGEHGLRLALPRGVARGGAGAPRQARHLPPRRDGGGAPPRRRRAAADLDLRDRDRRLPGDDEHPRPLPQGQARRRRDVDRLVLHLHRHALGGGPRARARQGGGHLRRGAALAHRHRAPVGGARRAAVRAGAVVGAAGDHRGLPPVRHRLHLPVGHRPALARDPGRRARPLHGGAADVRRALARGVPDRLRLVVRPHRPRVAVLDLRRLRARHGVHGRRDRRDAHHDELEAGGRRV
ncbi:MAG: Uncharacterized MFS-type transporter, partial [uncultured Gemmatimonadaceae bacterium]